MAFTEGTAVRLYPTLVALAVILGPTLSKPCSPDATAAVRWRSEAPPTQAGGAELAKLR